MKTRIIVALAWLIGVAPQAVLAQDAGQTNGAPAGTNTPSESQPAQAPTSSVPENPTRIRIGGNVETSRLIHNVAPVYPADAKAAHVEGTVVLHAIIAKDGTVKNLEVVSGPPMLTDAAMDAVKQWTYHPTLLNGEPVEVDTQVTVHFVLDDDSQGQAAAPPGAEAPETGASSAPQFAPPAQIDPQLRADIMHLLDVTHAQDRAESVGRVMFQTVRPQVMAALPLTPDRDKIADVYLSKVIALFRTEEFTDGMVDVYARYFSDDDVKAMTAFYETPAGQHLNEHMTDLQADSINFGRQLAMDNVGKILMDLCEEFSELQGQAKFCPASDQNKIQPAPPATPPATPPGGSPH
ncbi:MAG: TonB family protein [Candidatus Acidiferrales bacterium]